MENKMKNIITIALLSAINIYVTVEAVQLVHYLTSKIEVSNSEQFIIAKGTPIPYRGAGRPR